MFYAGIGSRQTPKDVCHLMTRFAAYAQEKKLILRSGHAKGADIAFEKGVSHSSYMQIFLPWKGFNGASNAPHYLYGWKTPELEKYALKMAESYHPNWDACSEGAKKMHARNCQQILGPYLDSPVKFVVCWTQNASGKGGTGQALRLAKSLDIPIFDFGVFDLMAQAHSLKAFVEGLFK